MSTANRDKTCTLFPYTLAGSAAQQMRGFHALLTQFSSRDLAEVARQQLRK